MEISINTKYLNKIWISILVQDGLVKEIRYTNKLLVSFCSTLAPIKLTVK